MKASLYGKMLVLASAFLLAPAAGAQDCSGATPFGEYFDPGSGGFPTELFVSTRPDLSNPGARALALGGAFIATADDGTSVVANPAGLGAIVRPGAQVEIRYNPTVQYDRYGEEGLLSGSSPSEFTDSASATPFFVSGVLPVGDKIVLGAFFQTMFDSSRQVDRIPTSDRASTGPCYSTKNSRGTAVQVLVPLYNLDDETTISRTGVSAAFRAAPGLSLGASVYYLKEKRNQTSVVGDASAWKATDFINPSGNVSVDGSEVGFEVGAQYSLSDAFRVGLVWSSEVVFGNENKSYLDLPSLRTTVLPMRVGVGFSWAFHPRWSLAVDTVYLGTSKEKDGLNFSDPRPLPAAWQEANWTQDDTWEVRAGFEWAVVQTRTTAFTARAGGWVQTASDLRFDYGDATVSPIDQYYFDALSVNFPKGKDDPFTHATFGFGLVSQKKWQFDVGADYEFKTSTFVASGLIGYTF